MRWVRFVVLLCLVTLLQAEPVNIISVTNFNIKPDLLLILLVFCSIYLNTTEAIITSFCIGFSSDLISPAMGPTTVSFGFFGVLLAYTHRVIAIRKKIYQGIAILIMGILSGLFVYILTMIKAKPVVTNLSIVLTGTSVYSGLIGPVLFVFFAWLMRINTKRFSRDSHEKENIE